MRKSTPMVINITGPINPRMRQLEQVQRVLSSSGIRALLSVSVRAIPDEPAAQRNQSDGPRFFEPVGLQQIEIREKEKHAHEYQDECADGPRTFCIDDGAGVGRPTELACLCDAVRIDRHVAIEAAESDAEECSVSAGHVATKAGDDAAKDEDLNQSFDVFAVVNRAEAGNKAEGCGEAWIYVWARACCCTGASGAELTCEQIREAVLAIEGATHFARALRAKRFAAIAAIAGGFAVSMDGAGHRGLLVSVAMVEAGKVAGISTANMLLPWT